MNNEKINATIKLIKKQYGDEAIMVLGEEKPRTVKAQPSGSLLLDQALGIGGYPVGRIVEIYGPESSGKTTLALHAIAEAQKGGKIAAFIDVENALDVDYARNLGVDVDNLILSQPDSGEQALEITELLVKSKAVSIIVVDSVAALVPKVELEGEMSDQTIGAQARLMSKALRKMAAVTNHANVIVIFINQLREKVGVIYGSPEVTTGGRALKFYSSVRIDIRKGEIIKRNNEIVGIKSKVKVIKNKVAPPFKQVELEITYGEGICQVSELIDIAVDCDIINKSGSWYSYGSEKIGQGKESVKLFLQENSDIYNEIKKKVDAKINLKKEEKIATIQAVTEG